MVSRPLLICVDDEPPVLSALRRLLRQEPYELITTADPGEALAQVGDRRVDLVITDQRMPEMAGTELLRAVRTRSPHTLGVLLTGYTELPEISTAMDEGAVDRLIRKPWNDEGFLDLLQALLAERRGPSPAPPPLRELRCAGRPPALVLEELRELLRGAAGPSRRVLVSFLDLMGLAGSVTGFLTDVVREVFRSGARATLIDGTGTADVFLDLVGGTLPVVVYRSPADLPAPKRILVVEDRPEALDFLRALLESAGHGCDTAGSAADALRLLRARRYDLVLLDLARPDAEGPDLARRLVQEGRRVPILAVSGEAATPFRARDILDAVRKSEPG